MICSRDGIAVAYSGVCTVVRWYGGTVGYPGLIGSHRDSPRPPNDVSLDRSGPPLLPGMAPNGHSPHPRPLTEFASATHQSSDTAAVDVRPGCRSAHVQ
jgi:hypothetical protein